VFILENYSIGNETVDRLDPDIDHARDLPRLEEYSESLAS